MMDIEIIMRAVTNALQSVMEIGEGIITTVDDKKYIIMKSEDKDGINVSEITEDDCDYFQDLKDGEIIFFEEE